MQAEFLVQLKSVLELPGFAAIASYIRNSYQNDPFRVALEALLVFFTLKYLFSKPSQKETTLTEIEINEMISEWIPQPLVTGTIEGAEKSRVLSVCDSKIHFDDGKELLNLNVQNYLGLHNTDKQKALAIDTVRTYGIGTCGPAGFYGTLDVHLKLEKELARVFGTESAIIYAQGFAAISSVIPAFSKRGDVIVADELVNMAILKGLQISRSRLYFYKHNDMAQLERILVRIDEEDRDSKRALSRRFIVAEGLYSNSGEILPLRNVVALKERFKYRLILDESNSFGALGPNGLGIGDYFGISVLNTEIDIVVGNLSSVIGSAGGFCVGSESVVDHQRLSSQAYCFSASLPAVLARCGLENLLEIEKRPELSRALAVNVRSFRDKLGRLLQEQAPSFELVGHRDSPLMFVRLKTALSDASLESRIIDDLVSVINSSGLLVSRPAYIESEERFKIRPMIKLVATSTLTIEQIDSAVRTIIKNIVDHKVKNF